jgi:hydroxycarboxylate dehydrogenase B
MQNQSVDEYFFEEPPLRRLIETIFAKAGSEASECQIVANHLLEANLRGHDSHGVGMVPAYIANALEGEMKLNHTPRKILDQGNMLIFDGELGLGQSMATDVVNQAIARAKSEGTCVMALRNSHHIGRIGHWSEQCAAHGLISLHFVNVVSKPSVAPFGGRAARIGTNPISIGIPRQQALPVIVDFATSQLAVGKIRVAYNKKVAAPEGALLDSNGEATNNPAALFEEPYGALRSFGEHKGWALAFACEALAAALSGGKTQSRPKSRNAIINSLFSIVVSPEKMGTQDSYFSELEDFIRWVQRPPEGQSPSVLLPGDPERQKRAQRLKHGIPVDATTFGHLIETGKSVGLTEEAILALAQPHQAPLHS